MSIWGRRDGEPSAEEAHEGQAGEHPSQAEAHDAQEPVTEHQAEESAPAFWRAQGETPASLVRDPADAPPPAYEHVPPAEPAVTEIQEPTVAVAHEPVVNEAQEPAVTQSRDEAQESAMTEAGQPAVMPDSAVTEVHEPSAAKPQEPAVAEPEEPAPAGAERAATATTTAQRWSEILVGFVDDPRGSVQLAADAVDAAIDEFVNSVRARQRDLASTWQGAGADTEQLRTALRDYRTFWHQVQHLDLAGKTGA